MSPTAVMQVSNHTLRVMLAGSKHGAAEVAQQLGVMAEDLLDAEDLNSATFCKVLQVTAVSCSAEVYSCRSPLVL